MKFENRTVAIVSSPFQLLSTGEYIHLNKIKNYIIIILFYNKKELKQIKEVNKIYNLSLKIKLRGYPVIQYFNLFILSKKIKSCDNLLIGNFFSDPHLFFYNLILKSRTTVVDDGMIVTSIPNFIGSNKRILKPGLIKKIFYRAFEYPKKIDLFSICALICTLLTIIVFFQARYSIIEHHLVPLILCKLLVQHILRSFLWLIEPFSISLQKHLSSM